ncbi:transporter substrate-binding protein [Sulfitobacter sp. MF3-043]|uniref:transporter substrate-binding protein n=1 Tax=Sulfitobacter sediminivivens TaxID=3252902 RepID=UPI0036DA2F22
MGKRQIQIGLLLSRSGTYSLISEACRVGAMSAIAQINADPNLAFTLHAVERDPEGNIDRYEPLCRDILDNTNARHVVGCVTSSSRKEVIPTLERAGATLWYTVPYEGFEASDHVVYTHACPNQHLLPLLDWAMPTYGKRAYLTGSNYIWGWEMNRIARQEITAQGGEILGERYLPVGSPDVDLMIREIASARPDFILNSMIGRSQYQFIAAYRELAKTNPHFLPENCPIMSCNLTECELPALGDAAEGLVAVGPYFRGSTAWPEGHNFNSSHEAATFTAIRELARLLNLCPDAETLSLSELLRVDGAAEGIVDPQTHHTRLPVLIGQVEGGEFAVRRQFAPIMGDPYLSRGRSGLEGIAPKLRVVS